MGFKGVSGLVGLFAAVLCFFSGIAAAATVEVIEVESAAYGRKMPVSVVLPEVYSLAEKDRFPVAYLFHGAGDDHTAWPQKPSDSIVAELADQYSRIIICPTAGSHSWYTDSPGSPAETYIIDELIPYIDRHFRTKTTDRWLTGQSMGGFGTLKFGQKYPEIFSAYVGQSPCIDPARWNNNWNLSKAMGPAENRRTLLDARAIESLKTDTRPFGIIIGTEDFFFDECKAAHERLRKAGIEHFWHTMPGKHNWQYWTKSLPLVFEFLSAKTSPNTALVPVSRNSTGWWKARHEAILKRVASGPTDLIFVGDSITHAWDNPGNREICARFFGKYKPVIMGFSGDRTENVLWRLENGEVAGIDPKLAVVMIGTNNTDAVHYPTAHNPKQLSEGIVAVCSSLRKKLPQTKILLLGVFPYGQGPNARRFVNQKASELASKLADNETIFYVDLGQHFMNPDGTIEKCIMADYLHPTVAGNWIWAKHMLPLIEEIIGR